MIDTKKIVEEIVKELKPLIIDSKVKDNKVSKDPAKHIQVYNSKSDFVYLLNEMKERDIISSYNENKDLANLILFKGKKITSNNYNSTLSKINNRFENYNNRFTIIEVEKLRKLESRIKELESK